MSEIKKNGDIANVTPRYKSVTIDKGNGKWYHGYENPLQCRWRIVDNIATCYICERKIERRIINEG